MVGTAIKVLKFNPMIKLFTSPGLYIGVHIAINLVLGGLNAFGVIKDEGAKIANIVHSSVSIVVMLVLLFISLIYGGAEKIKNEQFVLFCLLIAHIVVNVIYFALLIAIPEEEAKKIIASVYSGVSILVCVLIAIKGKPE